MKKALTLIIFMISISLNAQDAPDFRTLNWKMTQQQVKAKEKGLVLQESTNDELVYSGTVLNKDAFIFYDFIDNQLSSAYFGFTINNVSKNKYVEDFNIIKEKLIAKYGQPNEDITEWRENLYKDDPDNIGMAIACEHVVYRTVWYQDKTAINLLMTGKEFKISISLYYQSVDLIKEKIENDKNKIKDEI
ncbi:MAG: hypothetical protein ACOYN4_11195 [Bacteroidales bacterium]